MFTVLSNTRSSNMYVITALAIALVVLLTLAVVPSIAAPQPAIIPVTGSQNAYAEFIRGEKVIYANPARSSKALSAYHIGEKAIYASVVDSSSALSAYLAGEKAIYVAAVDASGALSTYHLGEKAIYTNTVDSAVSAWRSGEKGIVPSDIVGSALLAWRQGEKELK